MAKTADLWPALRSRLVSLLPAGGLGRSVSILVGGAAAAQGIGALSSILIVRLYSPSSFGQYGAASALVAVLVTVGCLRYEVAIPLPYDEDRAANVLVLSILAAAAVTAALSLLMIVAGGAILTLFHANGLLPYAWLLLAAQFGGSVYIALLSFAIRHKQFGTIARTRVTQSVAGAGTQIAIGLVSSTPAGLMAGEAVNRTAGSGRLSREAWHASRAAFGQVSLEGIRAAAYRYRTFAILSSPAALLNSIGLYAPLLLVVALYGPRTGGLFALGLRLIETPLVLLTTSVAQVFTSEAAILARDDPTGLRVLFARTMRRLIMIGLPAVLAIAVGALLLTGPVFGIRWKQAGVYVAIMAPFYLFQLATSPLGGTLDVLERQDLHLIREVVRVAITCGAVVAASALHLPSVQAIALLSLAGTTAYGLYGLISWHAITQAGDPDARLVRSTAVYAAKAAAVTRAPLPDGARCEILDARNIESVFVGSRALVEDTRALLAEGYLGIAIVNETTWIAYGWLAFWRLPPHLPRRTGVAPWIFRCRSRELQQQSASYPMLVTCLLDEARRRGLGGEEMVYIDEPVAHVDTRLRIEEAGFKPDGRILTVRLPRSRRTIGRWAFRRA